MSCCWWRGDADQYGPASQYLRSRQTLAAHGGRRDQTPRVLLRPHHLVFYESDGTVTIAPRIPPLAGVLLTTNGHLEKFPLSTVTQIRFKPRRL